MKLGPGVDQSSDMLLWDGIPLNVQKMGQVSQGADGLDEGYADRFS